VSARVVEDDVEFLPPIALDEMPEKAQEVGAGVRGATFTDDLSGDDLEGGIETCDAGASVVMGLPCGQPWANGQEGLCSLQGLDLGLLVEAEDDGISWGVQVEPYDIMDSLLGLRVGDELEALEAMGLEIVSFPDAIDGHVGDTGLAGHLPSRPLGESFVGFFKSQGDDLSSLSRLERGWSSRARLVVDTCGSFVADTASDATDLDGGIATSPSDLRSRDIVHHEQDGSCPPAEAGRCGRSTDELVQFPAVFGGEIKRSGLPAHGM
jgi:hypothetical protein